MSKRPTTPYGHVAFGKDGSVRPELYELPNNTKGQEKGVAENFLSLGADCLPADASVEMLPEADHDFLVKSEQGSNTITVQAIEVVLFDYCTKVSEAEYLRGSAGFQNYIAGTDCWYGIDHCRKKHVIEEKVRRKHRKRYVKPAEGEFWLLIWSVTGHHIASYWQGGKRFTSPSIIAARDWIKNTGSVPFDKVFYFELGLRPELVWPAPAE